MKLNQDQLYDVKRSLTAIKSEIEQHENGGYCCPMYLAEKIALLIDTLDIRHEVFERDAA